MVFFAANDLLWRTDGTVTGTHVIYDGHPEPHVLGFATLPAEMGGAIYYGVETQFATYLYKTDGTTTGTVPLATIPEWWGGAPCGDGKLCFAAAGSRIGVTDGTSAGTSILLSTAPGVETFKPRQMATMGKRVFFNAYDPQNGLCTNVEQGVGGIRVVCGELWTSDGTVSGTHLFADLNPGPAPSAPENMFVSSAQKLYFNAAKPGTRNEYVWVSDGTPEGTRILYAAGPTDWAFPAVFTEYAGRVYFTYGNGDLYETDGTPEGTFSVRDRLPIDRVTILSNVGTLNGRMMLYVNKLGTSQLWSYDGSDGVNLHDFPRPASFLGYLASTNRIYFATTPVHENPEFWSTDGTTGGTVKLFLLPQNGSLLRFAATADRLYYLTGDSKMFVTDGSERGTREVDLSIPVADNTSPAGLTAIGGKLYFSTSRGMAVTDGTTPGTVILSNKTTTSSAAFEYDGHVYFSDSNNALWITDGTPAGSRLLTEWLGAPLVRRLPAFIGDAVIFADEGFSAGSMLTRRNPNGTLERLGPTGVLNRLRSVANGVACWFQTVADVQTGATQLMFTDGTPQGTKVLASNLTRGGDFLRVGNRGFFGARPKGSSSLELWVTDSTAEGTRAVTAIPSQPNDGVVPLFSMGDLAIFTVGSESALGLIVPGVIWRSDGTAAGTYPLDEGRFGGVLLDGGQLILSRSTFPGFEIWTSDGTRAGTKKRESMATGELASRPFAHPGGGAAVAYVSPSAPNQTLIRNIQTGEVTVIDLGELRNVGGGTYANGRYFFPAFRGAAGFELWTAPLAGQPSEAVASVSIDYRGTAATPQGRAAVFRVSLETTGSARSTVMATTVDGTLTGARDYVPLAREIVFENDHPVTLMIPLHDPAVSGTMSIVLTSPVNATIHDGFATALVGIDPRRRSVRH